MVIIYLIFEEILDLATNFCLKLLIQLYSLIIFMFIFSRMSRLPPILSLFSAIVTAYFYALIKPLLNSLNRLNPCYNTPACKVWTIKNSIEEHLHFHDDFFDFLNVPCIYTTLELVTHDINQGNPKWMRSKTNIFYSKIISYHDHWRKGVPLSEKTICWRRKN